jgi:hypothetical protein
MHCAPRSPREKPGTALPQANITLTAELLFTSSVTLAILTIHKRLHLIALWSEE